MLRIDDIPQQVADDIQGLRLDLFVKVCCNKSGLPVDVRDRERPRRAVRAANQVLLPLPDEKSLKMLIFSVFSRTFRVFVSILHYNLLAKSHYFVVNVPFFNDSSIMMALLTLVASGIF